MEISDKTKKAEELILKTKLNNNQIAKKVELSREWVRRIRQRLNLDPMPMKKQIPDNARKVLGKVADYKAATYYGVGPTTIRSWRYELGIPRAPIKLKVTTHPDAKWEIIGEPFRLKGVTYVKARCICGKTKNIVVNLLKMGRTRSCSVRCSKKSEK